MQFLMLFHVCGLIYCSDPDYETSKGKTKGQYLKWDSMKAFIIIDLLLTFI